MAKVLILNGSCRKKSNTAALTAQIAAGAEKSGHDVETVEAGKLDIKPCTGCEACQKPKARGCIIKDGMTALYPAIAAADILIFGSPVYWFNLCGQIKQIFDRCFAIAMKPAAEGLVPFSEKKIGLVMVYGDSDPLDSGCVNAVRSFQDICAFTGAKWAGAVYGSALGQGEIERNKALLKEAKEYGSKL